jgi:Obg family GTPase CgtA-like protein
LRYAVSDAVLAVRALPADEEEAPGIPVLTLDDTSDEWQVTKKNKKFVVTGQKAEQFARRTDFENDEGVQRLRDIMRRQGILHELRRQGVEAGDKIQVGDDSSRSFAY